MNIRSLLAPLSSVTAGGQLDFKPYVILNLSASRIRDTVLSYHDYLYPRNYVLFIIIILRQFTPTHSNLNNIIHIFNLKPALISWGGGFFFPKCQAASSFFPPIVRTYISERALQQSINHPRTLPRACLEHTLVIVSPGSRF